MDRRVIALLTVSHCVIDLCQAVVPALLPFFIERYHLSYADAAALVLASSLASSIVQPLFGSLADRLSTPWLLPVSLIAAGGGLVLAGLSPLYGVAMAAVAVSGLGVAAFHPEAARLMNFASGTRRTIGMSVFSLGGNAGFALGPVLAASLLIGLGQRGLLALLLPPALAATLLMSARNRLSTLAARHRPATGNGVERPPAQWRAFSVLGLMVLFRSAVFTGLNTFLALYWIGRLGQTKEAGAIALTLFLTSGVVGTLLGGWVADRWGRRTLIRGSLVSVTLFVALLATTQNVTLATLLLLPLGLSLFASTSAMVVLGQEYLPGRVGVASGVTIGLAVSCGGAAAPLLGWAADLHGIAILPMMLAALGGLATVIAFALPSPRSA